MGVRPRPSHSQQVYIQREDKRGNKLRIKLGPPILEFEMNLVLLLLVTANAAAVDRTLTGPNTNEENTADVENTKMPGVGDRSHTNSGSNNNNDKINTEITQETNKKENKEENKTTNSYNVIIPIVILMKKGYLQWPHYPAAELPIDEPDVLEQIEVPAPNPPTKSVLVLGEKQSGK